MTRVHLLLPYWGEVALLDAAIESVLAQDDDAWTLTVVDDRYPDPTARERWSAHPDPRITYLVNDENLGVAGNFERCRTLASGDLAVFMGSDDLLDPHYVRVVRELRALHPTVGIIQPGVRVIDADGAPCAPLGDRVKSALEPRGPRPVVLSGEELAISLLRGNWLYWPSLAFDTALLARHSFRADYEIILDLALVMEMVREGASLVVGDEVCFSYRRHAASASSATLLRGERLADERRYFVEEAQLLRGRGWPRAARTAERMLVSRLHALTLLPTALRAAAARDASGLRVIGAHLLGR